MVRDRPKGTLVSQKTIFTYTCSDCGEQFESYTKLRPDSIRCPSCIEKRYRKYRIETMDKIQADMVKELTNKTYLCPRCQREMKHIDTEHDGGDIILIFECRPNCGSSTKMWIDLDEIEARFEQLESGY